MKPYKKIIFEQTFTTDILENTVRPITANLSLNQQLFEVIDEKKFMFLVIKYGLKFVEVTWQYDVIVLRGLQGV